MIDSRDNPIEYLYLVAIWHFRIATISEADEVWSHMRQARNTVIAKGWNNE